MIRYLAFAVIVGFFVVAGAGIAPAEEIGNINNSAPSNSPPASSVNENFELNIDSERIIEQDYKSSTSICFGEETPRSLSLQIGSVVRAKAINMHLQNIHGQVHFRGTWEPVVQNLRLRRGIFGSQSNQ